MRVAFDFDRCIVCLNKPANSWEHLIPKFLGGRLQLRVLCRDCNNSFGTKLVSALRSDPAIRTAIENLREEVPELYSRWQESSPYVGKAEDGTIVRVARKGSGAPIGVKPKKYTSQNGQP